MIRFFSIGTLFLSVFFFPYSVTLIGMGILAFFIPAVTLCVGILVDLLYAGSMHLPIGTLTAAGFITLAYIVRTFTRSHILSA